MIILFLRYFWYVVHHKLCILLAGFRMNQILHPTAYRVSYKRLLLHDLSKFSQSEFWPYAEYFFGGKKHPEEFHRAWLHHVHHNDHHWEHFIDNYASVAKLLRGNDQLQNLIIREMPTDAVLEMVADIIAATRRSDGHWPNGAKKDGWKWMTDSFGKFRLHPITRLKFVAFLCALGYVRILPQVFDWATIEKANLSNEEKRKLLQLEELARVNN